MCWRMTLLMSVLTATIIGLEGCRFAPPPAMPDIGRTQLAHDAEVLTDERTLQDILATFSRADDALRREDLDALMAVYSKDYRYRNYSKDRLRLIWEDLFRMHRRFSATHVFSRIEVRSDTTQPMARITCSGSLWAISKLTGQRVNIDSWFSDVHELVYEDGAWRILGHAGETRDLAPYLLSPHPFF